MDANREYFNDLALLLQSSQDMERQRQLEDLQELGYELLLEFTQSENVGKGQNMHDLEDCILKALIYFVDTYLPREEGAPARIPLANSSQAFNLLVKKMRGEYHDLIRRESTRNERHNDAKEEKKTDVHSERHFQAEKERILGLRNKINESMVTRSGHIGVRGVTPVEFSAQTKREAFFDYWQNVVTEDNMRERGKKEREWCKTSLPKFRSKPDAENPAGREMLWEEFQTYFRKVCRRIKANVLRAASTEDVDLSLVLPRKNRIQGEGEHAH